MQYLAVSVGGLGRDAIFPKPTGYELLNSAGRDLLQPRRVNLDRHHRVEDAFVTGRPRLNLDEIGDVSGHGQLFGHVDLNASGAITGSGSGLVLYGDVSGSGTLSGTTLFGNLNIGSSPGAITLENVVLSAAGTTTFEVAGTDPGQFDQLMLVGSVDLDGLAAISFDSFTPDPSDTFQLIDMTSGWASSWFSSVTTPEGWTLTSSGLLAIPEPATLSLLAVGVLMACRRRRALAA